MKKIIYLLILSTLITYLGLGVANACSITPTKTITKNGRKEVQADINDFVITGKIIGIKPVPFQFDKTVIINALSVKVISSENNKAHAGDILYFYSYDISDSMCHKKFREIDPKRYTNNSIVKVINRDSAIPNWELNYRLILLKPMEQNDVRYY